MKLSIIVPVYNLEKYIGKTLDSLLAIRFFHDYEIIVVNDGSKDASEEVIRAYQQKTDKICLLSIENGGVANARNVGVRQAKGQYITFLDGDDTVEPDFYEKAVAELDAGGYDFVQGNYTEEYEDRTVPCVFAEQDTVLTGRKDMLKLYLGAGRSPIWCCVWGKVYRGELARRVSFDTALVNAEDMKYIFDILCAADRIKLIPAVSIHYFQRGTSIVHTMSSKNIFCKLAAAKYYRENNPYPELAPLTERRYLMTLQELYYYLCQEKDPRAGDIRRQMWELPIRELWPELDRNTRRRLLLHRFAGPVYDLYFQHIKK